MNPLPPWSREVSEALSRLSPAGDPLEQVQELRRSLGSPEAARIAAEQARLRDRARTKLRDADRLFLTRQGLEQSTPWPVAAARAQRIRGWKADARVLDATAGLGGDALELARSGLQVLAQERDRTTAGYLRQNFLASAQPATVWIGDARRPPLRTADVLLVDPDRRARGQRSLRPEEWSPPWSACLELLRRFPEACIKLAPGTRPENLGTETGPVSWQWVSLDGELKELALWSGGLALSPGEVREACALRRTADGWDRVSFQAEPRPGPHLGPEQARAVRWIAEPDPAVVRSQLVGPLALTEGLASLGPGLAYLGGTADTPPSSPLLQSWKVLGETKADPKRVRAMLTGHGIGRVAVKKRGHPDDPSSLERRFRGSGSKRGQVIVARLERGHHAYLVERRPVPPLSSTP